MLLRIAVLLSLLFAAGAARAQAVDDSPTTGTPQTVVFRAVGDVQMDVWLNGERAGITPFETELKPGNYYLTVACEGMLPIMERYTVTGASGVVSILPADPLTTENYMPALKQITYNLAQMQDNPHLIMIGILHNTDQIDRKILLQQAEVLIDKDPLLDILRARVYLDDGKLAEAEKAAVRATETNPDYALAWRTLATVLVQQGNLYEAQEVANQAVILEPNHWRNLRIRAVVYSKMGNDNAAQNDKERADELFRLFMEKSAAQ